MLSCIFFFIHRSLFLENSDWSRELCFRGSTLLCRLEQKALLVEPLSPGEGFHSCLSWPRSLRDYVIYKSTILVVGMKNYEGNEVQLIRSS